MAIASIDLGVWSKTISCTLKNAGLFQPNFG